MAYMNCVEQVSDGHYVLPQLGDMKTQVDAFLSEKLFFMTDEALWQQAAQAASYEGATSLHLMPDTHLGYGIPVGGVLVTDNVIVQAGSGYDISCGMVLVKVVGLTAKKVRSLDRRRRWIEEVESRVAVGLGSHRPERMRDLSASQVQEMIHYGAKPLGVNPDLCERPFIPIPEDFDPTKIERAWKRAIPQMGSLGGGNHFIEMLADPEDGSVWVMVHTGSRAYGWHTANHYFHEGGLHRGLAKNRREQSWLRKDEPLGQEYWAAHNAAANYAIANRWMIVEGVREAIQEVFNCDIEPFYEISHNLVQEEILTTPVPEGEEHHAHQIRGLVHRKGATRAFPAGHPQLINTPWLDTGHPVLIPGSMLHGAAILRPMEGAHTTACSVNHGSGRVMGRGHAKRKLACLQEDIDDEMRSVKRKFGPGKGVRVEGILTNTRKTPLDECGHVYKELDEVLQVLVDGGIAKIERRLFPVANIKGTD